MKSSVVTGDTASVASLPSVFGDFSDANAGLRTTLKQYFVQDPPRLGNSYLENTQLRELLRRLLPRKLLDHIEPDLVRFGYRCSGQLSRWGNESERLKPELQTFDGYGVKVDRVATSPYWDRLVAVHAEEGLVSLGAADAQSRFNGPCARVYQFAKLLMYAEVSATADCPLAMTQGAVKLLEELPRQALDSSLRNALLDRLCSSDPSHYATSGQWMTERTGGSDVRRTQTVARPLATGDRDFLLYGYKYFTSAVTSQMAFGLAKCEGDESLSLFYIPMRLANDGRDPNRAPLDPASSAPSYDFEAHAQRPFAAGYASGAAVGAEYPLNGIVVHRLKDKLGTRAVPTAELELRGTRAVLVGDRGRGVRAISSLFNITRIQNATGAAANIRRALAIARDYTWRRHAFGRRLADVPLHLETLARVEVEHRGATHMLFDSVRLLGLSEAAPTREERARASRQLRLVTPLGKLYTAKQAMACVSECLESLGALGYMEDGQMPRILRDSQVLPIWEGTTNVLAMDTLRALGKDPGALNELLNETEDRVRRAAAANSSLRAVEQLLAPRLSALRDPRSAAALTRLDGLGARSFAYAISRCYVTGLLALHAASASESVARRALSVEAAYRFIADQPIISAGGSSTFPWLSTPSSRPSSDDRETAEHRAKWNRLLALDGAETGPGNVDANGMARPRL